MSCYSIHEQSFNDGRSFRAVASSILNACSIISTKLVKTMRLSHNERILEDSGAAKVAP